MKNRMIPISEEVLTQALNYLATQPYGEVAPLINKIQKDVIQFESSTNNNGSIPKENKDQ